MAEETPVVPVPTEPVLEMLAAREGVRGPGADEADEDDRRLAARSRGDRGRQLRGRRDRWRGRIRRPVSVGRQRSRRHRCRPAAERGHEALRASARGPFEAPFPSDPEPLSCFSIAYASGKTTLYKKPGGGVRIKLSARTEWGSPRIFGVVRRRGDWISVQAPELDNGEVAWMETSRGAARLRPLGDAREPEEAAAVRAAQRPAPCAAS